MRDLLLTLVVFGAVPFVLKRPVLGVYLFTWLSLMNPHRLTWGFAFNMPFAQVTAIATLIGMVVSREPKRFPVMPVTVVLVLFVAWMNVTTWFAFDQASSMITWDRMMKIQFFILITLLLLHSKEHVQIFMWIVTLSMAFFGVKGGIFTIVGGGQQKWYGPFGSFIDENNALALALIMTIPLLRFLQLQVPPDWARWKLKGRWVRWGLTGVMVLCGFSVLGSQSRGGFLGVGAMLVFLWLKSRKKLLTGVLLVALVPIVIGFMPEKWEARMRSIETYDEDSSAMGRINAWLMAYNLAKDRPFLGGGFEIYTPAVFARYAPDPTDVHAAHSIYFQVLGEHGFVGLALFLLLWILVWRNASWIVRQTRGRQGWLWASDLGGMIQVSLIGYAGAGAFLSLAYFDLPYDLLAAIVITRVLVEREIKENPAAPAGWHKRPAVAGIPKPAGQATPPYRAHPTRALNRGSPRELLRRR